MENRSWRIARRNGFTAIETVVTVVVLAILAAYATPKLFGLKEQADATEEILKIKDIEARHSQEMLKAGKRGVNPTLGDVVGFRPEVVAEQAPDTAPSLVSYSFFYTTPFTRPTIGQISTSETTGKGATLLTGVGTDVWMDPTPSDDVSCADLSAGLITDPSFSTNDSIYINTSSGILGIVSLDLSSVGSHVGGTIGDPSPKCVVNSISTLRWGATAGSGYVLNNIPGWPAARRQYVLAGSYDWHSSSGQVKTFVPGYYRYDCSPYSQRYGVMYRLGSGTEKSGLYARSAAATTTSVIQTVPSTYYEQHWTAPAPPANMSICSRVGPAPSVPPSDPGDPGAYPMATDGSGYCLSQGRKLPTYRDGSGTPTSSASDSVVELATEAVDDPTNCPG